MNFTEELKKLEGEKAKAAEEYRKTQEKIHEEFVLSLKDSVDELADAIVAKTQTWWEEKVEFEPTELEKLFMEYKYDSPVRALAEQLSGETIRVFNGEIVFDDGVSIVPIVRQDTGHNYALDRAIICVGIYEPNSNNDVFIPQSGGMRTGNHMTNDKEYFRIATKEEVVETLEAILGESTEWFTRIAKIVSEE